MTKEAKEVLSLWIGIVFLTSPFSVFLVYVIYTQIKIRLSKGKELNYWQAVKELKK